MFRGCCFKLGSIGQHILVFFLISGAMRQVAYLLNVHPNFVVVKRPLFYRTSALHSTLVSFIGNNKLTSNGERKAKKREDANEILPPTLIVGTDDDCCCYETLSRALQTSALISTYSTAQHWLLILSISHFILRPHLQYTVFSRCLLFTLI